MGLFYLQVTYLILVPLWQKAEKNEAIRKAPKVTYLILVPLWQKAEKNEAIRKAPKCDNIFKTFPCAIQKYIAMHHSDFILQIPKSMRDQCKFGLLGSKEDN